MSSSTNPLAGCPATDAALVDLPKLIAAYYTLQPDPALPEQRVAFGTSGHRGCSLDASFNEPHILAVTQAICDCRARNGVTGPLFIGFDTHALSRPAFISAIETLAANGVHTMIAARDEPTPTPAVSHAILAYNRGRDSGLADGIVITPSHNPPSDGGFKYNPPSGGPAGSESTRAIQDDANRLLESGLSGLRRIPFSRALRASTTHTHDYVAEYVDALPGVIDLEAIRASGLRLGVDPLGGAGVHYWAPIADRYRLNLTVLNTGIDYTFRFMTLDWDGRIRMDPSSQFAMRSLIGMKDRFDVAFACDTDHDRHGIVTAAGLMPSNHYLAACVHYLFSHRPDWSADAAVGKTVVSSALIDRVAAALPRPLYEVPVGFKFFVDGLLHSRLGFAGEESAGASFLRHDGGVWTTDKDGLIAGLLAAEMTARTGRDPAEIYRRLTARHGQPLFQRTDAPATAEQKARLQNLSPADIRFADLAGEPIRRVLTRAPGDNNSIGGVKVIANDGWFAARPSGTEDVYKIYAESFRGPEHLRAIEEQARAIVSAASAGSPSA